MAIWAGIPTGGAGVASRSGLLDGEGGEGGDGTMIGAVALLGMTQLRRRRWTWLLSALTVALVAGAVLTAAAGARRTASVLDRMQDAHPAPDLYFAVNDPLFTSDVEQVRALEARLAALDGVERVVASHAILLGLLDDEFWLQTGPDDRFLESVDVIVVDGRLPSVDGEREIALDEFASEQSGLGVGDVFVSPTMRHETAVAAINGEGDWTWDGPELVLDVVGIYRSSLDVDGVPDSIGSPDTGSYIGEAVAFEAGFAIGGDRDVIDIEQAYELAYDVAPEAWIEFAETEAALQPVRETFDMIAVGLAVFALVALAAGLVAMGQIVSRQISQANDVAPVAGALGMSHREITVAAAVPAIVAIVIGALIGSIASVALSPMFPTSAARRAEVDPGIRLDWTVLVAGALLIVMTMSAWALFIASRQVKPQGTRSPATADGRWTPIRRMLPVSAGVSLGPVAGRARTASSSAVAGSVLGVAGVVAISVFVVSQQVTADDAARVGWGWDSQPWIQGGDEPQIVSALAEDDRLEAIGTVFCGQAVLDDAVTSMCALEVVSGSLSLTYLGGRAPSSPDEVAVGRVTMNQSDIELGDTLEVTGGDDTVHDLTVVGVVVQPDEFTPGEGLVVSAAGFAAFASERADQYVLLDYPDDVDTAALESELAADYPLEFDEDSYPSPPNSLRQLERVRSTLIALALFLGTLGVIGLVHHLILSGNRRRLDTAVLQAIGFVRRQTMAVAVWQAVAVAAVGAVIGVPLGLLVGRRVWVASVDHIGIADQPAMPWLITATVVVVALLGAAVLALGPGWWMARRSPSEGLRTE